MSVVTIARTARGMPAPFLRGGFMASESGDEKERDEQAAGKYPELARLSLEITKGMSSRQAARRGGVTHDVIARMWNGQRVSVRNIAKFTTGFHVEPLLFFEAAGYTLEDVEKEMPRMYGRILREAKETNRSFIEVINDYANGPIEPNLDPLFGMSTGRAILEAKQRSRAWLADTTGIPVVERILEPDELEILDAYEGLPEAVQASVKEHIISLRKAADEEYRKRMDIIGKLPEDDESESFERISVDEE